MATPLTDEEADTSAGHRFNDRVRVNDMSVKSIECVFQELSCGFEHSQQL